MLKKTISIVLTSLILPLSSPAHEITVRSGDTLSQIAIDNNIPLKELMDLNNINNPNTLSTGQKLNLKRQNHLTNSLSVQKHTVREGESLNAIASYYGVSPKAIIQVNNLTNGNLLYIGQTIQIPLSRNRERLEAEVLETNYSKNNYHIVSSGDTLSEISIRYKVSMEDLNSLNNFRNKNFLKVGEKIVLVSTENQDSSEPSDKKPLSIAFKDPDWRSYGPLKVDWANWKLMSNSYVTPTINKNGSALYLAVNCLGRKLNATGINGDWRNWIAASDNFEHDLINDLCKTTSDLNLL